MSDNEENPEDEELEGESPDLQPFFDYLHSDKGHAVVNRLLDLLQSGKQSVLDKDKELQRLRSVLEHNLTIRWYWIQASLFVLIVVSAGLLAYFDRFSTPLGLLPGTLVGYIFSRRHAD